MEKFPARRQGNQWRQAGPSSLRTSGATFANKTGTGLIGTTGTGVSPGFETLAVPDKNMTSIAGSASQALRRPPHVGNAFGRRSNKTSVSEADKLFKLKLVEKCAEQVMSDMLREVTYDSNACRDMSPEVASAILEKIKQFSLQQYKLVCVVSLGSLKEKPGVQFGSRCLWNKDTDNFVSVRYSNGSVYAVAMIFGLYFD
ncbi:hypothetical protein BaRGS_00029639 [Batillaria attramentaria]|uniref:Dynein light chain n=1 Tax=Batillaria attramentaria TaxID=370345 RepID=A0ABD0JVN7_9CAEN